MAHELTIRANGFAEIAWSGETPWHGLGQQLPEDADMDTWRKAAGLDWEIKRTGVQYVAGDNMPHLFNKQNVLYRSDNNEAMSVVSDRYKIVQPEQVLDFFKKLAEQQGFKLHTAGSLKGGKRIWALAETGQVADVLNGDPIARYVLLATSYDRGMATTAKETNIRVVCANTLAMADRDTQNMVSIPHNTDFVAEAVHQQLGFTRRSFDVFIEQAKFLASKQVNTNAFNYFMQHLLHKQDLLDDNGESNITKNRAYKKILELFDGGAIGSDISGIQGTRWQLLNAVTEYVDHHAPNRNRDSRLNNAWFKGGANMKTEALQLATGIL
jgi:phage/plasmid-like protein (TIGR03299 family)